MPCYRIGHSNTLTKTTFNDENKHNFYAGNNFDITKFQRFSKFVSLKRSTDFRATVLIASRSSGDIAKISRVQSTKSEKNIFCKWHSSSKTLSSDLYDRELLTLLIEKHESYSTYWKKPSKTDFWSVLMASRAKMFLYSRFKANRTNNGDANSRRVDWQTAVLIRVRIRKTRSHLTRWSILSWITFLVCALFLYMNANCSITSYSAIVKLSKHAPFPVFWNHAFLRSITFWGKN